MKKINMKTKGSNKTFDEGFEQFILEHCTMKNLRPSTEKHYILWLKESDIRDNDIPSDDTIRIVISNIDSRYFYEIVIEFFMEIVTKLT